MKSSPPTSKIAGPRNCVQGSECHRLRVPDRLNSSSLAVERPDSYYGGMNERALELNPWRVFNAA